MRTFEFAIELRIGKTAVTLGKLRTTVFSKECFRKLEDDLVHVLKLDGKDLEQAGNPLAF